jgi:hypothetical protein
MRNTIIIGVVGPCSAGKSTLIAGLRQYGYNPRHIAQEHSYVPYMWQRLTNPDILIYLDVSYPVTMERRKINWTIEEYLEQVNRLQHARRHANYYLNTDQCSIQEVLQRILAYLQTVHPDNT